MQTILESPPKTSSPLFPKLLVVAMTVFVILFAATDAAHRDVFMKQSIWLSLQMQQLPSWTYAYFWVWTYPAYYFATVFPFIFLFYASNKEKAVLFLLANMCIIMLTETIKVVVHDTRPCFQDQTLAAVGCSCSFGMISGHASICLTFFTLGYRLFYHKSLKCLGRTLAAVLLVWIVGSIAFSRLYFGAHSWNQVLMGLLTGLVFTEAVLLFKRPLLEVLKRMLRKTPGSSWVDAALVWFCFWLFWACHAVTAVYLFFVLTDFDKPDNTWLLQTSCSQTCYANNTLLTHRHVLSTARMAPFAFVPIFLHYGNRPPTVPDSKFSQDQWRSIRLVVARMFVFMLILWPFGGAYLSAKVSSFLWAVPISWICGVLFSVMFVFSLDRLLVCVKARVDGDYFSGTDYRPLESIDDVQLSQK
jgi:membrane-associated phospholipid phosphatase